MQDDSGVGVVKTIVVSSLPCELVVDGFVDEYSRYLGRHAGTAQPSASILPLLLGIVAWLMLVVGGLTLLFGPDSVTYSIGCGPTFFQFIQLYPGPIVSVGFLLLIAGQFFDSGQSGDLLRPELFLLAFYELQLPDGREDLSGLSIVYAGGDLFLMASDPS
ncbi:hypothetical protein [Pseudomonas cichorii]|uniref:hypothetical protein n=1 Tax=Pseudomonas cichorii TaxID=36746 RepID=UPI001C8932C8|nr:hypothetical protein [Pseudomonas cichorii]MBX8485266.1 hypothetical protein [Pseudomonas cichorii]MBX8516621.1 hypothetical protein [Pseudomonas cichorii]